MLGAGGHGSELHSYMLDLAAAGKLVPQLVGFLDDSRPSGPWLTTTLLGKLDRLRELTQDRKHEALNYITAVGDNDTRRRMVRTVEALELQNLCAWTLQHPSVHVGFDVRLGAGTLLAPGVVITTRVHIGAHCILNVQASISHDCIIRDFANINPGAVICGNVSIGQGAYIGAGATIINKISIGDWAVIGAGAVVIRDVPAGATAVGVPARVIKT